MSVRRLTISVVIVATSAADQALALVRVLAPQDPRLLERPAELVHALRHAEFDVRDDCERGRDGLRERFHRPVVYIANRSRASAGR
jgi:hypothetical protein